MNAGTEGTIDTKRLIFPALGGLYQSIAPYSYAIIRFCAGSDRHLSRLYEALRWLRRASGAECFDAARLPAATGLGLFPWRPGIFWRRSARRGISHAAARAHVHRADGDRDLLARRQRILLLEPAWRLGVPVAVNDPLCSDLLPRRRTLRCRSHDRQRVLEHNPSQTVVNAVTARDWTPAFAAGEGE